MEAGPETWQGVIALVATILCGAVVNHMAKRSSASPTPSDAQATVIAGTITDSKTVTALAKALEGMKGELKDQSGVVHRDFRELIDVIETLCRRAEENTSALKSLENVVKSNGMTNNPVLDALTQRLIGGK